MVHRPSDSRLLNSLLSSEKDYHKHLLVLLDSYSQQSLGAFAAYASASPAPVSRAVIAVAGSLAGADDALRRYAASVEAWQEELRTLKDLEEDVANVMRDREILVTRLIKLSKNQKPTRDSFIGTLSGDLSQTSLNSISVPGAFSSKLGAAQAELQACEGHLAAKEKELDELRLTAVRRGLDARCKAMVECGWSWGEMGKEGLRALEAIDQPLANGADAADSVWARTLSFRSSRYSRHNVCQIGIVARRSWADALCVVVVVVMVLPNLSCIVHAHIRGAPAVLRSSPSTLFVSSLRVVGPCPDFRPSQSASQIHLPISPLALPTDQPIASTPPRVTSPPPMPHRSSSPRPHVPQSSSFTLQIPPAHSISEFTLPSTLTRRITEEPEPGDEPDSSSEEDARPVEVVENARFALANESASAGAGSPARRFSLRAPRPRDNSGSNTTSSGTGTGTGSFSQPSTLAPIHTTAASTTATLRAPSPQFPPPSPVRERKSSAGFFGSIAGLFRGSGGGSQLGGADRWKTRTETNLRAARRGGSSAADSDSEDGGAGSRWRFNRRRASHDSPVPPPLPSPPPPLPAPSASPKLRKKNMRTRERESEGWISDSAAIAGRGALKGSIKKRASASDTGAAGGHARSASAASLQLPLVESTPPRAKPRRVDALAGADVSRQSSLRSSASAPAGGIARNGSAHSKSKSGTWASSPPQSNGSANGSAGQMSLMAIVEGVARSNRTAWERVDAGVADGTGGAGSGLVSVRAPPSVGRYNLRGAGGKGISFESVLAPPSVFAAAGGDSGGSRRPASLPPPARAASVPTTPVKKTAGAGAGKPLRSALRNSSPPPVPPVPMLPPKPLTVPRAPPRVVVPPPPAPNGTAADGTDAGEESDSASIASYRTVRETLDDLPASPPLPAPPPAPPGKDESDVSASTVSAGVGRRKSVRMALQPTFSATPPALDEEDADVAWGRAGRPWGGEGKGRVGDVWDDSSDEDEEYAAARRMLSGTGKRRW
ncbi:hypothetical protein BC834DRAFT_1044639 [Gloeopeniophorella convolvens]|nr:hypothetical protein BC834DRAFT_1044639 [Gloeopeniophorella convolvens]